MVSSYNQIKNTLIESFKKEDVSHTFTLFVILVLAFFLRLQFLFQPMRYDEAFTFIHFASKSLSIGLSDYIDFNNHLFHTFLVHISYLIFGNHEWAIRLPAFLFGILIVPLTYILTRIFFNKYAALLGAALTACSSVLIEFSTNARGYTLLISIFLFSLCFAVYLRNKPNRSLWLLFSVVSALGFYTMPLYLFPFGIVIICFFILITSHKAILERRLLRKNLFISLLLVGILTFLLYLPVFIKSGIKSILSNQFVTPLSWHGFLVYLQGYFPSLYQSWIRDIPFIIQSLLLLGFFVSLCFSKRVNFRHIPIVFVALIWCVSLTLVKRRLGYPRVWLFLLPVYLMQASAGIVYLFSFFPLKMQEYKPQAFSVLVLGLSFWLSFNIVQSKSVYYSQDTGALTDAREITDFLKHYLKRYDIVFAPGPSDEPLEYYFEKFNISYDYLNIDVFKTRAYLLAWAKKFKAGSRIIIVQNHLKEITLSGILEAIDEGLRPAGCCLDAPKLLKNWNSATVYELTGFSCLVK